MSEEYLLFECEDYYPKGGWHDFIGYFDTLEEAMNYLKTEGEGREAHVVHKGGIVFKARYIDRFNGNSTWEFFDD